MIAIMRLWQPQLARDHAREQGVAEGWEESPMIPQDCVRDSLNGSASTSMRSPNLASDIDRLQSMSELDKHTPMMAQYRWVTFYKVFTLGDLWRAA